MNIVDENTSRKIDNLGRISIPKSLRDRVGVENGGELEFYMIEHEGKQYIGCAAMGQDKKEERKRIAAEVLTELGYDVPEELK